MCLIVLRYEPKSKLPLVVAANRDEFYRRRAAPLTWWPQGRILAGRDLGYRSWFRPWRQNSGLGTWLGVNRHGKFAALTNVREPGRVENPTASRGLLVSRFLFENLAPEDYARELEKTKENYAGYNLLFGGVDELYFFSNRDGALPRKLTPGIYGLSNAALDTPWHKVEKVKREFSRLRHSITKAEALELMYDGQSAPDEKVQQTGMPFSIERGLSSPFIRLPGYGTRATSFVEFHKSGKIFVLERTYERGKPKKDREFEVG